MRSYIKLFLVLILFLLASMSLTSNTTNGSQRLVSYVDNIKTFHRLYPQEKVYLHFDNTGYFRGETIWYKAYITSNLQNRFTDISRVLYVELLAPEGNVVKRQKLKIEEGQCHGEFVIDEDYHSGFYEVRAYTRYMLNWERDCIFSRVFPVYEKPEQEGDYLSREIIGYKHRHKINEEREANTLLEKVTVTFYPEGGNLIKDINSRIAFKIINEKGENVDIEGSVYNRLRKIVKPFKTEHQGMGLLEYIPSEQLSYIEFRYNKKKYKFNLPDILPEGLVMLLDNLHADSLSISIEKSSVYLNNSTLGLSIQNRGNLSAVKTVSFKDNKIMLKVPKIELMPGVNQVTLFDGNGQVLSERLFFIMPSHKLSLRVKSVKEYYKPFEKIKLDFETEENFPLTFSLSVRDKTSEIAVWEDNIMTNMLLSSDLKGHIENPSYYFLQDIDGTREKCLDLLMMVQGWRCYFWTDMAHNKEFDVKHRAEEGIVLEGQIVSEDNLVVNIDSIRLKMSILANGNKYTTDIKLDDFGKFRLFFDDFEGLKQVSFVIKILADIEFLNDSIGYKVLLDRVFSPKASSYSFYDTYIIVQNIPDVPNDEGVKIKDLTKVQVLPEIIIKGNDRRESRLVYNVDEEKTALLDQGKEYPNTVLDYLKNKGVPIQEGFGLYQAYKEIVLFLYGITGRWEETKPDNIISKIPLDEIKQIRIYDSSFAYKNLKMIDDIPVIGKRFTVLVLPYDTADILDYKDKSNVRNTKIEGYSRIKEFYNPDYGKNPPIPGDVDYRRTLYWNPNVKVDENGKASVGFYNNSSYSKITVSAEGITNDGNPIVFKE